MEILKGSKPLLKIRETSGENSGFHHQTAHSTWFALSPAVKCGVSAFLFRKNNRFLNLEQSLKDVEFDHEVFISIQSAFSTMND